MTIDASLRAREAFISPSARGLRVTLARASREASASAAIALCSCTGNFTSLISTRSTFIPQSSVRDFWCPEHSLGWSVPGGGWLSRHW
uniref:Uncharacterized protein n=1 Tax=Monodelphis domestica TaxID=13616 RepID=A0A5F8GAT7_MONDO